jgi:amino-acid N-acetyltransferase
LLPRTAENILKHISNFIVAEYRGCFIGTVALRDFGDSLYEIRSLAVKPGFEGGGTGSKLVESLLQGLKKADVHGRVFALTYRTAFFMRMGFKKVSKELFPQKIWSDCAACPKKDCCDEEAVMLEI